MRGLVILSAILLLACGGGGGHDEDTSTDTPQDTVDTQGDTSPDTTPDTATDDVVEEVECTADGDCDDGDPCTVDSCDLDYNECEHGPVDADGDGYPAMEVEGTTCTGGTDCNDADPLTGEQECEVVDPCCDGCRWLGCWYDDTTGYQWENPPMGGNREWNSAVAYCDGLSLPGLGAGEWHLPTISELRTLVRGCPATETGGACGVTDACLGDCNADCGGCGSGGGPGAGGCYWDPALEGSCNSYWSSSSNAVITSLAWFVGFADGDILGADKSELWGERCVHLGP